MSRISLVQPENSSSIILEPGESQCLIALAKAVDFSLSSHVSKHAVLCKFGRMYRGEESKHLRILVRKGLATKHPTRGELTWQLTKRGLQTANCIGRLA